MQNKLILPIPKIWLTELITKLPSQRVPEPSNVMSSKQQALAYQNAGSGDGAFCGNHYFILEQLLTRIHPGDRVLDLCCGTGDILVKIAELCPDTSFVGVDLSEEMLKLAQNRITEKRLKNIKLVKGDITNLSTIESHSFDMVSSTMALHHLESTDDLNKCFSEISRLVKNDGALFLFDFVHIRNESNMQIIVNHIAGGEAEIFQQDFMNSLKAAFFVNDFKSAFKVLSSSSLKSPVRFKVSAMPLLAAIGTPPTTKPTTWAKKGLEKHFQKIPLNQKFNYWATRLFLWM